MSSIARSTVAGDSFFFCSVLDGAINEPARQIARSFARCRLFVHKNKENIVGCDSMIYLMDKSLFFQLMDK